MKKPPQRSRVIALRGKFHAETISQEQLRELESAQRAEWLASKRAALFSERVRAAIQQGASVEPGPLFYDPELEMVRSRKRRTG